MGHTRRHRRELDRNPKLGHALSRSARDSLGQGISTRRTRVVQDVSVSRGAQTSRLCRRALVAARSRDRRSRAGRCHTVHARHPAGRASSREAGRVSAPRSRLRGFLARSIRMGSEGCQSFARPDSRTRNAGPVGGVGGDGSANHSRASASIARTSREGLRVTPRTAAPRREPGNRSIRRCARARGAPSWEQVEEGARIRSSSRRRAGAMHRNHPRPRP